MGDRTNQSMTTLVRQTANANQWKLCKPNISKTRRSLTVYKILHLLIHYVIFMLLQHILTSPNQKKQDWKPKGQFSAFQHLRDIARRLWGPGSSAPNSADTQQSVQGEKGHLLRGLQSSSSSSGTDRVTAKASCNNIFHLKRLSLSREGSDKTLQRTWQFYSESSQEMSRTFVQGWLPRWWRHFCENTYIPVPHLAPPSQILEKSTTVASMWQSTRLGALLYYTEWLKMAIFLIFLSTALWGGYYHPTA